MTRWKLVLILWNKVLVSAEFNWDMYPEGYGDEVKAAMKDIKTEKEFREFVKWFNAENFWYDEDLVYELTKKEFDTLKDLWDNSVYFEHWFSDYLFFKNMSDDTVIFNLSVEDWDMPIDFELEHNEFVRFHFWNTCEEDESDFISLRP